MFCFCFQSTFIKIKTHVHFRCRQVFVNSIMILKNTVVWIFSISLLASCQTKEFEKTRIIVDFSEADSLEIEITHYPPLQKKKLLGKLKLDSANNGSLEFDLSEPLMSYASNGKRAGVYLCPNDFNSATNDRSS